MPTDSTNASPDAHADDRATPEAPSAAAPPREGPAHTTYHCPDCHYPLWDLKARQCPECGRGFRPSEFRFVRGAVRFRCPHCAQAYYGMDEYGQLVPRAFSCVKCGNAIAQDEMVVSLREDVGEERTRVHSLPWLSGVNVSGTRIGWFRRWLGTVEWGMTSGRALGAELARDARASVPRALVFACVNSGGAALAWIAMFTVLVLLDSRVLSVSRVLAELRSFASLLAIAGVTVVGYVVWGVLAHLVLLMLNGAKRGMGATVQGVLYSTAAASLMVIPGAGFFALPIVPIWSCIAAVAIVTGVHGIPWWKAFVALIVWAIVGGIIAAAFIIR